MSRWERLRVRVLSGTADQNIRFDELCQLLATLGFVERVRGGHHIFTRDDVVEIINLQPRDDRKAKPYQVRQVRELILRYKLSLEAES